VGYDEEGKKIRFTHPYFQCANMFIGEFCCLIVFGIKSFLAKKKMDANENIPLSPGT